VFVPPILQVLAFPRRRDEVQRWAETVAAWDFERIIPAHLDGPIAAGPAEFARAIEDALTTDGYSQFGPDIESLTAVDQLSIDLKSLEEPRPLTRAFNWQFPAPPAVPAEAVEALEGVSQ
jgi:hypothetical protein